MKPPDEMPATVTEPGITLYEPSADAAKTEGDATEVLQKIKTANKDLIDLAGC
jgi:hypothetical protein